MTERRRVTTRKVLFITAANRTSYFRETMASWQKARGFYDWRVVIRLEPSSVLDEHLSIIEELQHENLQVVVNPKVYGVLHHPWVGFEELFRYSDFVVRAEDDLIVSSDILEYFSWAADEYNEDQEIAAILAYTENNGSPDEVSRVDRFSPWVWGTWHDRWVTLIRDTWDHDYSTFNGHPGNQSGWDWNLDTRVLPSNEKKSIAPLASRVQNIGVWGTHGTEFNFVQTPSFLSERAHENYFEVLAR